MTANRRYATDCLVALSTRIDDGQGDRDAEAASGRSSADPAENGDSAGVCDVPRLFKSSAFLSEEMAWVFLALSAESTPEHTFSGVYIYAACSCGRPHPLLDPDGPELFGGVS